MLPIYSALQLMAQAINSGPVEPQCAIPFATQFVERFSDVPEDIRNDILRNGKVAERGQPFSESDAIIDPNLPRRRFMRAGRAGWHFFVWLDHGGFARHDDIVGYSLVQESVDHYSWRRSAEFQGEPCIAINAFFSGVWTPVTKQQH